MAGLLGLNNTTDHVPLRQGFLDQRPPTVLTLNEMRLGIFDEQFRGPRLSPPGSRREMSASPWRVSRSAILIPMPLRSVSAATRLRITSPSPPITTQ